MIAIARLRQCKAAALIQPSIIRGFLTWMKEKFQEGYYKPDLAEYLP
jgi:hypothetical protein